MISKQGRDALIKVAEWLEAGAPHVDVDGRRIDVFDMNFEVCNFESCGTKCCIAGAVYQFEGLEKSSEWNIIRAVKDYLSIPEKDADRLFFPWEALSEEHETLKHNPEPFSDPAIAAAVIREYLETGEIDWLGAGLQVPEE